MNFETTLRELFPEAMGRSDFAYRTYNALYRHGFGKDNTLACVSVCRDEATFPLVRDLRSVWGDPFDLAGLAGVPMAGRSAFAAAAGHAPVRGGRRRCVFIALSHLAIDRHGQVGWLERAGQSEPTAACGALSALLETSGGPSPEIDPDDAELSMLRLRLSIGPDEDRDLVTITRLAHEAALGALEQGIGLAVDTIDTDYGVSTGIQIHGPGGREAVWPGTLYAVAGGERHELGLG